MTIVQKAQRFDEAIERARKELQICGSQDCDAARQIFRFFPELAESEDEKMVKFIKNQLFNIKKTITENYELDVKLTKAIDWLEKQGEQSLAFIEKGKWYVCIRTSYKPNGKDFIEGKTYYAKEDYKIIGECGEVDIATDNPEEFFRSATEEETNDIIKNFVNEQKSATDFSDLRTWKYIVDAVLTEENGVGNYLDRPDTEKIAKKLQERFGNVEQKPAEEYNITGIGSKNAQGKLGEMIKKLKSVNEVLEQNPAWSEEDEKMLDTVIEDIVKLAGPYICYHTDVEWLKSLKERYTWKPSDEQILAIETAINVIGKGTLNGKQLVELQEQLKKLREK